MLWTLLTLISSLTLIVSAVMTPKQANAALGGYALAVIVGLVLAACNLWALERVCASVDGRVHRASRAQQEWFLGVLYLAAAAWALVSPLVGARLTSAVFELIL